MRTYFSHGAYRQLLLHAEVEGQDTQLPLNFTYLLIEIAFVAGDRFTLLNFEVWSPLIANRGKNTGSLYCNASIFCHHPGDHIWKGRIKFCYSFKSDLSLKDLSIGFFICCWIRFLKQRGQTGSRDLSCPKLCSCWAVPPHCTGQEQGSPCSPPPCGSMMNDEAETRKILHPRESWRPDRSAKPFVEGLGKLLNIRTVYTSTGHLVSQT